MPRSRNTRIRRKDTSRIDARRRYREEQRAVEAEPEVGEEEANAAEELPKQQSAFAFSMPNVLEDIKALPQILRARWMFVPFAMLAATFILALAMINGLFEDLPEPVTQVLSLYVSLTLHPTTLFIFFIGGLVAPRGAYLIGGILGFMSSAVYLGIVYLATEAERNSDLEAITSSSGGELPGITSDMAFYTIGMGLVFGILGGAFAAWYRRFLRNSQERARINRMHKEQEQALKAKEQAKADKQALRDSRRRR